MILVGPQQSRLQNAGSLNCPRYITNVLGHVECTVVITITTGVATRSLGPYGMHCTLQLSSDVSSHVDPFPMFFTGRRSSPSTLRTSWMPILAWISRYLCSFSVTETSLPFTVLGTCRQHLYITPRLQHSRDDHNWLALSSIMMLMWAIDSLHTQRTVSMTAAVFLHGCKQPGLCNS